MDNITILRGKKKTPKEESPCQTSVDVAVLEVQVENIEDMLKEHKKNSEKRLDGLETKIEQKFTEIKEDMAKGFEKIEGDFHSRFNDMQKSFERQQEKIEEVEEKISTIKNGLTALVTKVGIFFSAAVSVAVALGQFVLDKLKG